MQLREGGEVKLRLGGANPSPMSTPLAKMDGASNYFVGSDSTKWRTGIAQYGKVRYGGVYAGIDLVYYGNQQQLEYDFVVSPGADPAQIKLDFSGADRIVVDRAGDLELTVNGRTLKQHKPVVYQEIAGRQVRIESEYQLQKNGGRVQIALARYDRSKPLVIDPTLVYSTYFGGSGDDSLAGIAADASGNAYLTGTTSSSNFATTSGAYQTSCSPGCVYITKLNASGTQVLYSTYLGGSSGNATVAAIAVDSQSNAYVTGTAANSFPTTSGAYRQDYNGGSYLAKLSASGTYLIYSTSLDNHTYYYYPYGCSSYNYYTYGSCPTANPTALAVDPVGNAYVTGSITFPYGYYPSYNLPLYNALQSNFGGGNYDAFVIAMNAAGTSPIYSTYLGGSGDDIGTGIAVDASGSATVVGTTSSTNFPSTTNGFQATKKTTGQAGFATRLSSSGNAQIYSTYLGGSGTDSPASVTLDAQGNAYITGSTSSSDFPTTATAFQSSAGPGFLTKLPQSGSSPTYSTYLPAAGSKVVVDTSGLAYVAGSTSTAISTTPGAIQSSISGGSDAYLLQFSTDGSILDYGTYLGGSGNESTTGLAIDPNGYIYLGGTTTSTNFPTLPGVLQPSALGGRDVFVAKLNMAAGTCTFTLGSTSQAVPAAGGLASFNVSALSGCPWVAASNNSFVTITSGASGSGNGTVTFNVAANNTNSARTATITAAGQTFTINQAAATCTYTLGGSALSFNANGGISNVTVSSPTGCSYTATSNASFITINSGASGSGNGTVNYTVAANTGINRTGTLTIGGQTYTITQNGNGCFFTLGASAASSAASATTGSVAVTGSTSSCTWTSTSSASWLTITSGATGTGSGTVSYSAAANPSSQPRSATLSIGGQTFTVTQAGASCSFSLSSTSGLQGSGPGAGSVALTATPSDCTWAASSNSPFLTITSAACR